jgi:hypothetical protein
LTKALFSGSGLAGNSETAYMLIFDQENKLEPAVNSESFIITFFLKNDGSETTKINIRSVKNMGYGTGLKSIWNRIAGQTVHLPGENIDCSAQ